MDSPYLSVVQKCPRATLPCIVDRVPIGPVRNRSGFRMIINVVTAHEICPNTLSRRDNLRWHKLLGLGTQMRPHRQHDCTDARSNLPDHLRRVSAAKVVRTNRAQPHLRRPPAPPAGTTHVTRGNDCEPGEDGSSASRELLGNGF